MLFIVSTSLFYGFIHYKHVAPLINYVTSIIPIQLQRFHWLHPTFWLLGFAIILYTLNKLHDSMKYITSAVLMAQIIYCFSFHELYVNRNQPTYCEFFAERQFRSIADYIGRPTNSYRVASLGLHPSIAQFNGFYTVDGYMASYPLSYKHKFGKLIEYELNKSEYLKNYFESWGSRAYLFSAEIYNKNGMSLNRKGNTLVVKNLDIDTAEFRNMGGQYIISAVKLSENTGGKFKLEKIFNDDQSAWDIYLYSISG